MKQAKVEEVLEEIRKIREKNKEIYREMGEIG
jgi:chaperonin cofactor prefoldin